MAHGVSPLIWSTYSLEAKNAVATSFNCQSIGHFEEDYLNLGHAIIESNASGAPNTEFDATLAVALAESIAESDKEEDDLISSDEAIAEVVAADEASFHAEMPAAVEASLGDAE